MRLNIYMTLCKIDSYMSIYIYIHMRIADGYIQRHHIYIARSFMKDLILDILYMCHVSTAKQRFFILAPFFQISDVQQYLCVRFFCISMYIHIDVFWCQKSWLVTICYDLYVFFWQENARHYDLMFQLYIYIYT